MLNRYAMHLWSFIVASFWIHFFFFLGLNDGLSSFCRILKIFSVWVATLRCINYSMSKNYQRKYIPCDWQESIWDTSIQALFSHNIFQEEYGHILWLSPNSSYRTNLVITKYSNTVLPQFRQVTKANSTELYSIVNGKFSVEKKVR